MARNYPLKTQKRQSTGRSKYGARKTKADGYTFDSLAEYAHYCELLIRVRKGEISSLTVHNAYPIVINGIKICKVMDDFSYIENGKKVSIDVKGVLTSTSRLKAKLVKACYPDLDWRIVKV